MLMIGPWPSGTVAPLRFNGHFGLDPAVIPSGVGDADSPLLNDGLPAGCEFNWFITALPTDGTLLADDLGTLQWTGGTEPNTATYTVSWVPSGASSSSQQSNTISFADGAGVQAATLGGVAERNAPGGLAMAAAGSVVLQLGGLAEADVAGGAQTAANGAAQALLGGLAEREAIGGLQALAGTLLLQIGGADERERVGGFQTVPGVVGLQLGGAGERERAGGLAALQVELLLALGGGSGRAAPGGLVAAGIGVAQMSLGGRADRERPGGLSAGDGSTAVLPTWPAGGTARIGGTPLPAHSRRIGGRWLRSSNPRIG